MAPFAQSVGNAVAGRPPPVGGTVKSHVSPLVRIWCMLYEDACAQCGVDEPFGRDVKTLTSRVENEGISFLTLTLPAFASDLHEALKLGYIDSPRMFRSFRKRGKAPAFLQGFLSQVFDNGSGRLLDDINITALEALRELTLCFKKLAYPCKPIKVVQAMRKFKEIEIDVFEREVATEDLDDFLSVSNALWSSCLSGLPDLQTLLPKHGPGATAEGMSGNEKYTNPFWHERLEPFFPLASNMFSSEDIQGLEELEKVTLVPEEQEKPVKVIDVPKTLKGPRIIAIEPVCMQYTQQAISQALVSMLEKSRITGGQINFADQTVNQRLALSSSSDGKFATLDLSAASDRVPLSLAARMFDSNPDYQGAILACRSTRALMPDGEVIHLRKFASMGSALCFPIEAMYFYTICVVGLLKHRALPLNLYGISKVAKEIYVYGDDLIVPTDAASMIIDYLHKYYCKVGTDKSFYTGKFRESCGLDAFDGQDVTPVYIRQLAPDDQRQARELISWVATSNLLFYRGYWKAAQYMMSVCEKLLGALPVVRPNSAGLGKYTFCRGFEYQRFGLRFHRPEVRTWMPSPVYRSDRLDGVHALLKCLLNLESGGKPEEKDKRHLSRTARHHAVTLKRGWVAPY